MDDVLSVAFIQEILNYAEEDRVFRGLADPRHAYLLGHSRVGNPLLYFSCYFTRLSHKPPYLTFDRLCTATEDPEVTYTCPCLDGALYN
jgi:hypothetical protein